MRHSRPHMSLRQRAGLIALTLLCGGVLWIALHNAAYHLQLLTLEREIRALESGKVNLQDPARADALRQSLAALHARTTPADTRAMDWLARGHWLLADVAATPTEQIAEWRAARTALHHSLRGRKRWPYSWLLLAQVEYALYPAGPQAPAALHEALRIGLRGQRLQRQLLDLRKRMEPHLDPALEAALQASYIQGLRDHGPVLAEHTLHLGRYGWTCAEPEARAWVEAWCVRMDAELRRARR